MKELTVALMKELIEIDVDNGMVNITKLGQLGGKRPNDWVRLKSTEEKVQYLSHCGDSPNGIVESRKGGNGITGTWICKDLVYDFAMWVSVEFWFICMQVLDEVFSTGECKFDEEFVQKLKDKQKRLSGSKGGNKRWKDHYKAMCDSLEEENEELKDELVEIKTQYLTPTELGKKIGVSARKINQMLQEASLQDNIDGKWYPTEEGENYSACNEYEIDTGYGKRYSFTIIWSERVIDLISY